jgi:hypothetical protein
VRAHRLMWWTYRAMCCALVAACADPQRPEAPDSLILGVAVLVDSAKFQSQGAFVLDLVPSDRSGQTYISDEWEITAHLTSTSSVTTTSQSLVPPDSQPVAAAILIDDSGSMRDSDPNRDRALAAQLFWREVLGSRLGNVVALLDFGRGDAVPSTGFEQASLLREFTSNVSELDAVLDRIQAVAGARTPLYQTGAEALAWIDSTAPRAARRSLVVITDGQPSDPAFSDSLFSKAAAHHVPVFAVGLGPAANRDLTSTATALVLELATRTGGIYAGADSAVQLQPILRILAKSANPARLLLTVTLDPIPHPGATVAGTVDVSGVRGAATAKWSFVAK